MEAERLRLGRSVGFGILRVAVGIVAQTHRQPERTAPSLFSDRGMFVSVQPLATTTPVAGAESLRILCVLFSEGREADGEASMCRRGCESGMTGDKYTGCSCSHAARIEVCVVVGVGTTMRSQEPVTNSRRGQELGQLRLSWLRIEVALSALWGLR